jgi:hypothetical protein
MYILSPIEQDADFMAELKKPNEGRSLKAEQLLRGEANEVWKEFARAPNKVHY